MFKKLYLSATLAALSMASSNHCSDTTLATKSLMGHIAQEKYAIVQEISKTMIIGEKAIEHMKTTLSDTYEQLTAQVITAVNEVVASEEFNSSLIQVTDYQLACIIDKGMHFDDITYNPQDYSTTTKAEAVFIKTFPAPNPQIEQLFNVFYVTIANYRNCKLLLERLDTKQAELLQELQALQASDNTIGE